MAVAGSDEKRPNVVVSLIAFRLNASEISLKARRPPGNRIPWLSRTKSAEADWPIAKSREHQPSGVGSRLQTTWSDSAGDFESPANALASPLSHWHCVYASFRLRGMYLLEILERHIEVPGHVHHRAALAKTTWGLRPALVDGDPSRERYMDTSKLLRARLNKALAQFPNLLRALSLALHATYGWTLTWGGLLLLQGLSAGGHRLPDPLAGQQPHAGARRARGWARVASRAGAHGPDGGRPAAGGAAAQPHRLGARGAGGLLKDHIGGLVHAKFARAGSAASRPTDFYDHLHRARDEASYRTVGYWRASAACSAKQRRLCSPMGASSPLRRLGRRRRDACRTARSPALVRDDQPHAARHRWLRDHRRDERPPDTTIGCSPAGRNPGRDAGLLQAGTALPIGLPGSAEYPCGESACGWPREQGQAELLPASSGSWSPAWPWRRCCWKASPAWPCSSATWRCSAEP